ncbi:BlaI/MecI/CopY family transcriptional regulator [Mucilaginibacter robiniae]|uniref:BlaI/MecI/CopY family transcriptional regulator n=1 Tax=Mucilaginibacter robiniae TaxID=2728022 RepID=A0A7L5E430_9SPHI|nr:BlaI/MecI/CopY family transcriptional regulator [Mucilaginibacter robiniae]QJD97147.1 BlaI/MecI/CopY family transcriptional regulator [Mucilaginibacter robiniae]
MKLTTAEEQLMEMIWSQDKLFMKDIVDSYPEPKPALTTIATLLKRMQDKNFVAYHLMGNSRQYYALVKKEDYFSNHIGGLIRNFFGNSALQFASFFTKETDLTADELESLKKIIDEQINQKNQ